MSLLARCGAHVVRIFYGAKKLQYMSVIVRLYHLNQIVSTSRDRPPYLTTFVDWQSRRLNLACLFNTNMAVPSPHQQLLPHIVDDIAKTDPERIWAQVPQSEKTYEDGFRKISYKGMANGVNGVANWLVQRFGHVSDFETLA